MPHAIEMPSFLKDNNGPVLSSHSPMTDVPSHLRQSYEKLNALNGNANFTSQSFINGNLDGGDPYMDGAIVANPQISTQSTGEHDASLSSIPNGRSSVSSWEYRSSYDGSTFSKKESLNGISDSGNRKFMQNGGPRTVNGDRSSVISANGSTHHAPPVSTPARPSGAPGLVNGESPPRSSTLPSPINTNQQSTGALPYTSSLLSSGPTSAPPAAPAPIPDHITPQRAATPSPHRYSSPASYPAPVAPSPSNSSALPGSSTLRHRHTLQVPKSSAHRTSRDGDDASSTGRFSPTAVATGVRSSLNLNRRATQSLHSNMAHEEIPPDENAMRWAEAVRQKRASKRRRKDEEDDDRVVVGTKVDQNHVNWVTAYNMLTGIRFTVSRTNAKMDRALTDADFDAKHKFSFDITGNELTPSAKYDFKFKDYAPWVFRHLRAKFKLDPADYLVSLTSKYILSELGSPGKSGSFFYFSRDYKYIIKTIHHAEHKFLRKMLREYYCHVEENPNTLLSQFYGLHRVKIPYGRKIHFVVMNNLFPPHRDIHHMFDLKGSTIGRDFREEELEKNPRATLKDLNWLRRNLHFEFGPEKKQAFIDQMTKDVALLQRLHIMDYSMLVGIHDVKKGNQENLRGKTLQVFQPGGDKSAQDETEKASERGQLARTPSKIESARRNKELRHTLKQERPIPMSHSRMETQMEENPAKKESIFYSDDGGFRATHEDNSAGDEIFFLSIIDCLTHYGTIKKLEHVWKGLSHDKKLISPIAPVPYGDRFKRFIEGITKCPEVATRETQPVVNSSFDSTRGCSNSQTQYMHRTSTNNTTLQRNETEALRSERDGRHCDDDDHQVIMSTARSPSAERTGGMQGQILPVVEELGEASSTGGKSARSIKDDANGLDARPVTPPNDRGRGRSPATGAREHSPSSAMKRPISRQSLDKELPPIPQQAGLEGAGLPLGLGYGLSKNPGQRFTKSPEKMTERESVIR